MGSRSISETQRFALLFKKKINSENEKEQQEAFLALQNLPLNSLKNMCNFSIDIPDVDMGIEEEVEKKKSKKDKQNEDWYTVLKASTKEKPLINTDNYQNITWEHNFLEDTLPNLLEYSKVCKTRDMKMQKRLIGNMLMLGRIVEAFRAKIKNGLVDILNILENCGSNKWSEQVKYILSTKQVNFGKTRIEQASALYLMVTEHGLERILYITCSIDGLLNRFRYFKSRLGLTGENSEEKERELKFWQTIPEWAMSNNLNYNLNNNLNDNNNNNVHQQQNIISEQQQEIEQLTYLKKVNHQQKQFSNLSISPDKDVYTDITCK